MVGFDPPKKNMLGFIQFSLDCKLMKQVSVRAHVSLGIHAPSPSPTPLPTIKKKETV